MRAMIKTVTDPAQKKLLKSALPERRSEYMKAQQEAEKKFMEERKAAMEAEDATVLLHRQQQFDAQAEAHKQETVALQNKHQADLKTLLEVILLIVFYLFSRNNNKLWKHT